MRLKVEAVNQVAQDTKEFVLVHPDGEHLPDFVAGAHIELILPTGGKNLLRRYSLTSPTTDLSSYSIAVLNLEQSRGGSKYLNEEVKAGDEFEVSAPFQAFHLDSKAPKHIIIAGGIGITPFVPMVDVLSEAGQPFEVHYAARNQSRFAYKDRLAKVAGEQVIFYSEEDGQMLDLAGLFAKKCASDHFYVCGPRGLIEAVKAKAEEYNYPQSQVHYESFGAAAKDTDKPIKVKLLLSGMEIIAEPGQTILDTMIEHGVWASYECRRGECASCVVEVVSGEPDHRDVCLTEDIRKNHICTCISWANSDELELNL
jgi:ferredoxin-NADP reductase